MDHVAFSQSHNDYFIYFPINNYKILRVKFLSANSIWSIPKETTKMMIPQKRPVCKA